MNERNVRLERVASVINKALAVPLSERARAHDVGLVTVADVSVSPDMRHADIALSIFADSEQQSEFLSALKSDQAVMQASVARALRTRRTPVIRFHLDDTQQRGARIQALLKDQMPPDEGE